MLERKTSWPHRLISHKDTKTAHTFTHQTEEQVHNLPIVGKVRRSKRISNKEKTNYFELATGGTLHTIEGYTAVAQHVTRYRGTEEESKKPWQYSNISPSWMKITADTLFPRYTPLSPNTTSAEPKLSAQEKKTEILAKDQAPETNFAQITYYLQTRYKI